METFVKGNLPPGPQPAHILRERMQALGYSFENGRHTFVKPGKIESVVIELVPVWEWLGLDAQDLELAEFNPDSPRPTAVYEKGRIHRAN